MSHNSLPSGATKVAAILLFVFFLAPGNGMLFGQQGPPPLPPPGETLTPDQLEDLVAPIALYPDPMLSQIMVASTYPLEVAQAYQWLARNPGLTGPALTQAAQRQNWDPSIQALVVFPNVLKLLNDDITWTTNLGNAFLSQQQDVMDAVQRMRQRAAQAGKLASTPQENVITTEQGGQPYIAIESPDPDVIYVPVYDPVWIWGPPRWYPYPHWYWPQRSVIVGGLGFGFSMGINVGVFFGSSWHGWGGWGWQPGWGSRTVIVNNTFIHRYNFNTTHITNVHGTSVWAHNPIHRQGVPYANPTLNDRYRGNVRGSIAPRAIPETARKPQAGPFERMGNREVPRGTPPVQRQTAFRGQENGRAAQIHAQHGFSSMGPTRKAPTMPAPVRSAPRTSAPMPRSTPGGGQRR